MDHFLLFTSYHILRYQKDKQPKQKQKLKKKITLKEVNIEAEESMQVKDILGYLRFYLSSR